nr:hypothetical protein [Tanacetum cinerariifolium]
MASRSQTVGDAVVPKFDMHVYTSVLTYDEVNSLVVEYAIPLYLHPCVPLSGLTMNRLPADKIVGLTTIWKHVGHHPVFEDGEGTATKDRASGKRDATGGISQRTKKKKIVPLSFTLSDFDADKSNRSGSGTHTSASPLNTIISNEAEFTTGGDVLTQGSVLRMKDNTKHRRVSSSSEGSHRQAFPRRNPGGSGIGSSLQSDADLLAPFVPAWSLTTQSILNDAESCRDMMINLATSPKEADLTEKLVAMEKERDDLLDKDREREERIQRLEADLASKTSSLTEAESVVSMLKGDLERLIVDLSHAEIIRRNYVRQLLPIVFQRLLSSDEYKKSLFDVFNLAIAARWSEGVKAACSKEEAEEFC